MINLIENRGTEIRIEDNKIFVGKNLVTYDDGYWLVEEFEFMQGDIPMYSCLDGFDTLEEAVKWAKCPSAYAMKMRGEI
jgi:hypothetical protein